MRTYFRCFTGRLRKYPVFIMSDQEIAVRKVQDAEKTFGVEHIANG